MIVVDASVLATALADDGADGALARARLRDQPLAGPGLVDLEVSSVLRRLVLSGQLSVDRAEQALHDLTAIPLQRAPHLPLLARCWSRSNNVSVYDAAYVALAEHLDSVLVTADVKLSTAPGLRCVVEVLRPSSPST